MLNQEKILESAKNNGKIRSKELSGSFNVSRQYVSMLIAQLVASKQLIKIGSTRNAFYVLPEYIKIHPSILPSRFIKRFPNKDLEEHRVLAEIEEKFPKVLDLTEHVRNI